MLTTAWTIGSIDFNAGQVRTGFTILALASDEELVAADARDQQGIPEDQCRCAAQGSAGHLSRCRRRPRRAPRPSERRAGPGDAAKPVGGKTPNLDQYTVDLTGNAKKGKIDPVLGRDPEIRQVIDILTRRRQNNPILTGEAGVGKTAVVEGFALRVAQGRCAAAAEERAHPHARSGAAAGRRRREGRIRKSPQGIDRRSEGLADAHHSVHRRSAHHDRRGRTGRTGRCRQPAEAGTGARRTAHHRRDHVVGIQEVLREGCRAGAPLPGRQGGRAQRTPVHDHDARPGRVAREAPQRAHPRRSGVRRR